MDQKDPTVESLKSEIAELREQIAAQRADLDLARETFEVSDIVRERIETLSVAAVEGILTQTVAAAMEILTGTAVCAGTLRDLVTMHAGRALLDAAKEERDPRTEDRGPEDGPHPAPPPINQTGPHP